MSSRRNYRISILALGLIAVAGCYSRTAPPVVVPEPVRPAPPPVARPEPRTHLYEATAYSIEGTTASGAQTREGTCAADPRVLPLGSRIRVHDAGKYSGEYLVTDTGPGIKGREIDIYLANDAEAKRFGRRNVRVEVLSAQ
jgi:3D (Asp-Asp-Asp) domain-containing protein